MSRVKFLEGGAAQEGKLRGGWRHKHFINIDLAMNSSSSQIMHIRIREGAKGAAGRERHGTEKGEDSWWNCEYRCRNDKFHNSHIWLMDQQDSIPCSFVLNRRSSASGRFIICLSLLLLSIYDFRICIECFYRKAFCLEAEEGGRGGNMENKFWAALPWSEEKTVSEFIISSSGDLIIKPPKLFTSRIVPREPRGAETMLATASVVII